MTDQGSDTLFPADALPGDRKSPTGRRTRRSRWRSFEKRDLQVTQEDIDRAMRENSHSCMIAEAIKRELPGVKHVSVDIATIRWTDAINNRRVMCLTPMQCQEGLARFDLGVPPKPFRFNLRAAQITTIPTVVVRGADGKAIKRVKREVLSDGTVVETKMSAPKMRRVTPPKARVELDKSTGDPVVRGGKLPTAHRASRQRKFGMRGFTWTDDENPEDVAKRQRVAYGVSGLPDEPQDS